MPIGFVCPVAGVILPRVEGHLTAGPSGLSAEVLPVHELDQPRYFVSGPALAAELTKAGYASDLEEARHPTAGAKPARLAVPTGAGITAR